MSGVTVVIPCFNANETLGLQLEALATQVDAPQFEVIVVDNASPVSPQDVVDSWRDRLDITLVQADAAQGVSYARNVGLSAASTDEVIFLDADDCASPDFVASAVKALQTASFVTGNVLSLEPQVFAKGLTCVWADLARVRQQQDCTFVAAIDETYPIFMGGASAVRRADAFAIGGFDQSYFPGAEDNDFGIRAVRAGYTVKRCSGMALAERRRTTSNQAFKRAYEGGFMHMRLCAGHDLWAVSPHLHNPEWWIDLVKLPLTGLKAALGGNATRHRDWSSRAGLRLGQGVGFLTYKVARRPVVSQRGLGLERREILAPVI